MRINNDELYLERGKELAIALLYEEMTETEFSPMIVMHPIFESAIIMNKSREVFNALDDKEKYAEHLKKVEQDIKDEKSLKDIVWKIRKSYRLTYIYYLYKYFGVDKKVCANLLANEWTLIETLTYDVNVKPREVLSLIKCADKDVLMDKDEQETLENMDDEIIIYRGARTKDGWKACSWTLEQKQGEWFANRYNKQGYTFKAKIMKKDVIAYISSRSEKEIIADFNKLYDVEVL